MASDGKTSSLHALIAIAALWAVSHNYIQALWIIIYDHTHLKSPSINFGANTPGTAAGNAPPSNGPLGTGITPGIANKLGNLP